MVQFIKNIVLITSVVALIAACDSGDKNNVQKPTLEELPSDMARIMNPFALEYGSSVPLPTVLTPLPDSWPQGALDRFAVPLNQESELPMFVEFEITIIPPENIIYASSAKRAYPTLTSCENAREQLSQVVERKISNLSPTNLGYENSEFGIYVGCVSHPGSRFINLDFQIFHKESKNLVAAILGKNSQTKE